MTGASTASGRGVDLGLRWRLASGTALGVTARNLLDKLSWSVKRLSDQTSVSEEAPAVRLARRGLARPASGNHGRRRRGDPRPRGRAGRCAAISVSSGGWGDLLTLRGGLHRAGEGGVGRPAFGATVRPMRIDALEIQYAYVADEIGAGARSVFTLLGQLP